MTILLTAAEEDSVSIQDQLKDQAGHLLHLPLERYVPVPNPDPVREAFDSLGSFENIIHANLRNARFFIHFMEEMGRLEQVQEVLNLAGDKAAAELLEEHGIPAVYPGSDEPIKMVEYMLRLNRMGSTLYPTGTHRREEIPGLLQELDIHVAEVEVLELEGPTESQLEDYRRRLSDDAPELVIFHSRRAVNRTVAAFPDLDLSECEVVSGDKGVTDKLEEHDIVCTAQAEGNWQAIGERVLEIAGE